MNVKKLITDVGKEHGGAILLAVNLVSTGVLIYEVWNRKDRIQNAIEETKGKPFLERAKKVVKEGWPIGVAAAGTIGSSVGQYVRAAMTAATLTEKISEATAIANKAIEKQEEYEKATKEVVGEEKEKEIREKVVEEKAAKMEEAHEIDERPRMSEYKIQNANGGFDNYYDEYNPGFVFQFNGDRAKLLESKINAALDMNSSADYCQFSDRVTLADVCGFIGEITGMECREPVTATDFCWKVGSVKGGVSVRTQYYGQKDGRGLFELSYYPSPKYCTK